MWAEAVIVYVGAGSGELRDLIIAAGHGQMMSRQRKTFPEHGRWAFDNGAYTDWLHGLPFDNGEFLERLEEIWGLPDDRLPEWCVVPDLVADPTSLTYSLRWRQALHGTERKFKWYLAIQDFMTPEDVSNALCMEPFDGIFIGGSTPWKLETAAWWIDWAHKRGLPVHLARINGPNRLQLAVDMDADSVDGTGWVRAGREWLPYLQKMPVKSKQLFPTLPKLPKKWLAFGEYLRSIWSEKDWSRFVRERRHDFEVSEELDAMTSAEFLDWLEREYLEKVPEREAWRRQAGQMYLEDLRERLPDVPPEEERLWRRMALWELERILAVYVDPPDPALPRFVIMNGDAIPLAKGLEKTKPTKRRRGGEIVTCETTGRQFLAVRDAEGNVYARYPIVRAMSPLGALEAPELQEPLEVPA